MIIFEFFIRVFLWILLIDGFYFYIYYFDKRKIKIKLFIVYMVLYVNILFLKKFDISDIWDLYM